MAETARGDGKDGYSRCNSRGWAGGRPRFSGEPKSRSFGCNAIRETLMRSSVRKLLPAALMGLAMVAVGPSHAQSGSQMRGPWMGGTMDTNFYIGANVGQSRFRSSCDGVPVPCDDKDVAWKAYAGYQFHPNFAVEGGYFDLGNTSASGTIGGVAASADARARGWELLGVAMFPVMNQLAIYGKLGIAFTRVDVSGTAIGGGFSFTTAAKDDSTDITFGAGVQYSFTRNISARLEWQRYDSVGGGNTGKEDIDVFSLGALFRF